MTAALSPRTDVVPAAERAAGLSSADEARLDELYDALVERGPFSIGYPCNQEFDYRPLYRFLGLSVNNVGDPFTGSNYRLNTHEIEREVLADFARFTGFREDEIEGPGRAYWGYVTNGGTEGNMYGLYLARELFRGNMGSVALRTIRSAEGMRSFVFNAPGAIGYVDVSDLDDTVKVVPIDRHRPNEPDYPLRWKEGASASGAKGASGPTVDEWRGRSR